MEVKQFLHLTGYLVLLWVCFLLQANVKYMCNSSLLIIGPIQTDELSRILLNKQVILKDYLSTIVHKERKILVFVSCIIYVSLGFVLEH